MQQQNIVTALSHYPPIVKLGEFFNENLFDHVRISNHEKWLTEQEYSNKKKDEYTCNAP